MQNIPGFEGRYSATEDGRIWSHLTNKFLSAAIMRTGYRRVLLNDRKHYLVHRLIALTYIPNHSNKLEVHHLNAVRGDNRVCNLSWATREENNQAAWDCGNKVYKKTDKLIAAVRKTAIALNEKRWGYTCSTI